VYKRQSFNLGWVGSILSICPFLGCTKELKPIAPA
jgi:hypothetical protein